ncbi:hypothetical protein ASE00_06635 [Sphingomonas sp. Root710]|uniref:hypothetical protein n=1 Tax=Sphingomonas sp. Root710 TaxID=1736594 RepID=UPI0006F79719|nr:hypothetical protein [Sphingomonas sp. Root710]KRB86915.1 hypothetical protein ASE00_06635 [Sphingomonas sp. Root710]
MTDNRTVAFGGMIEEQEGLLRGPLRRPLQMLAVQQYEGHSSIHDDETARKLGFAGGTIEGPTHFSQFAPLGYAVWGERWLTSGCISAHYRAPVFEGEEVRAFLRRPTDPAKAAEIWMERADGTEILRGTAAAGASQPQSALEERLASLQPLAQPVILADVKVGTRTERRPARMDPDQIMGAMYPFSLTQKLQRITEPSSWYSSADTPWGRPIVPLEMISVLMQYGIDEVDLGARGPAVGLFADQEIRLIDGPVFVSEPYEIAREVLFLSGSRRTESMWVRSTLFASGTDRVVAAMLLNMATLKDSYERYATDHAALYGAA